MGGQLEHSPGRVGPRSRAARLTHARETVPATGVPGVDADDGARKLARELDGLERRDDLRLLSIGERTPGALGAEPDETRGRSARNVLLILELVVPAHVKAGIGYLRRDLVDLFLGHVEDDLHTAFDGVTTSAIRHTSHHSAITLPRPIASMPGTAVVIKRHLHQRILSLINRPPRSLFDP
jgi:hypothetical protein